MSISDWLPEVMKVAASATLVVLVLQGIAGWRDNRRFKKMQREEKERQDVQRKG